MPATGISTVPGTFAREVARTGLPCALVVALSLEAVGGAGEVDQDTR